MWYWYNGLGAFDSLLNWEGGVKFSPMGMRVQADYVM